MTPRRRRSLLTALSALTLLTACGSTTSTSGQSADPTVVSVAGDGTETGTDATSSGTDTSGTDTSGIDRHDSAGDLEWDAADEQQIDLSSGSVTIENPGTYRLAGTLTDGQVVIASDGAPRDYGVAVTYLGTDDQIVRTPKDFAVDEAETTRLRHTA